MKRLSTLLAAIVVLASVGCQSDKHASRTVAASPIAGSPQISYSFDESFHEYFQPRLEYVFEASMRSYFGPHGNVALERALSEAYPGYQIQVGFENSIK